MMKDIDNRLVCSDEKKNKIRMTKANTQLRHSNMIVKCYECKIVEKRLNKKNSMSNWTCCSLKVSGYITMSST